MIGLAGALDVGLFVTRGLAEGVDDNPGLLGRFAPPAATARAAALSATLPPVDTGRVGSFELPLDGVTDGVPAGAGALAGRPAAELGVELGAAVEPTPELGGVLGRAGGAAARVGSSFEPDDVEVDTLGDASVVIGDAPPPGICRDVVPDR